jgi:hypothetical protein
MRQPVLPERTVPFAKGLLQLHVRHPRRRRRRLPLSDSAGKRALRGSEECLPGTEDRGKLRERRERSVRCLSVIAVVATTLVAAACGGHEGASCPVPIAAPQGDFECTSCVPETMYSSKLQPQNLAVDESDLFFTEPDPNGGPGRVMRIPLDGGQPVTVADGLAAPDDIVLDADGVYWSAGVPGESAGTVTRMARTGGVPTALASVGNPGPLALDGCSVYWASGGEIRGVPRTGGASRTLAEIGDVITCLAVSATELLAMGSYGLRHVSLDGSGVTSFQTTTQAYSMVARGDSLYVLDMDPDPCGAGQLECLPLGAAKSCGAFQGAQTHGYAQALALDGAHVWWLDWGQCGGIQGTIARVALDGGGPEVIVQPGAGAPPAGQGSIAGPHSIAVTTSGLFWIEGTDIRRLRR